MMWALIVLTGSCTGISGNDTVVSLGDTDLPVKYRNYINSAELTLLQDDTTCVVGRIEKVVETSDAYFVLNQKRTAIIKFNKQGNYIDKFYKVGHAKGEYSEIIDFSVDETDNRIVVLCDYTKGFVCDLSFQIQKIHDWQVPIGRICAYRSKIYGFYMLENRIISLSNDGSKDILQSFKPAGWVYSQTDIFHKTDDKLLVTLECDNTIYLIEDQEARPYLKYSYDYYEKAIEQLQMTTQSGFDKKPLLRIRNLDLRQDTLNLIYSKGWVIRFAKIDMTCKKLLTDGQCIGSPTPDWNGYSNSVLAGTFTDGEKFPIDTSYINRINVPFDSSVVGSVIVKYCK